MNKQSPTVGSFLFDYLYSKGVRHAFGIPGDFALPTFRWLENSKLKLITLTHEPSVGFAADGYARVHGMGVACVTYCVGGLNMLNSVACAYAEKSPMVIISGGPSPNDRRNDPLMHHKVRSFDTQRRIFEEVTCANTVLLEVENAASEIMRVIDAVQEQCRPGYIEVPYDIVDLPIRLPSLKNRPVPQSDEENLRVALEEAADMINASKQPVILADVELHRHGLTDLAVALSEKFNIPIAATLLSKSVIGETGPRYIGVYSGGLSEPACQKYVESSDCVIMLGAFITDVLYGFGKNTARLHRKNTILATTEKTRVGYHSYDGVLFKDFLKGLQHAKIKPRKNFTNPNPPIALKPLAAKERPEQLDVETFFRLFGLYMKEGSTVICDTGDALIGAIGIRTAKRNNFLSDAYYLSMGFAVPASIGAMAADPKSRTIVIAGDGAFQMTGVELSTAAKYGMKPIVFIINNDGYGTQRYILDGKFNNIHMWNYTKLCDMLGYGIAKRVETKGEMEEVMQQAMNDTKNMYLIEVVVPRDNSSQALRRLGEELGPQRDATKKKK